MCTNMRRAVTIFTLFFLYSTVICLAQRGADPGQRYFRIIALVHLSGSGQAGDPVVPEYVLQGTAVAKAGIEAAAAASAAAAANPPVQGAEVRPVARPAASSNAPPAPAAMSSRPGILGWSMQKSDDGKMAIVQMVAADRHAFDSILADTRPEVRVFEIGKTPAATIQAEMKKYKQDFDLNNFRVMVP